MNFIKNILSTIWLVGWALIFADRNDYAPEDKAEGARPLKENEMEDAVKKFAESMQIKLDKNKYKECDKMNPDGKGRSWKDCDIYWLLYRLRQETLELEAALYNTNRDGVIEETADVGNFAMMIHDIVLSKS